MDDQNYKEMYEKLLKEHIKMKEEFDEIVKKLNSLCIQNKQVNDYTIIEKIGNHEINYIV